MLFNLFHVDHWMQETSTNIYRLLLRSSKFSIFIWVKNHKRSGKLKWWKINHFHVQENCNTPPKHTPGNPPFANYERNPFIACWQRLRGVFQRCVETTLDHGDFRLSSLFQANIWPTWISSKPPEFCLVSPGSPRINP